ncbi:PepSY-associated TM helix domain-containing protein [uncultured Azonexus sp.]|uniref:PepSY-associated TM helix domain-containing protein n=1 Tax=uncultured Azonexus sp. TaxID=520307 RepID=UPI002605E26C|nr:PepSY-associated TM helix domain-containing protein [uncultured Azonexus sp.]
MHHPSVQSTARAGKTPAQRRARLVKLLHSWHWTSSAICLVGMLIFSFTGITLNHAGKIEAKPVTVKANGILPDHLLRTLEDATGQQLPGALTAWLRSELSIRLDRQFSSEWSDDEVYLSRPRPGGDAWLRIDRQSGFVEYENIDRGWISWLNDLHKGRHTGPAWSLFIDLFSLACLIFSLSGLLLLKMHAANRGMTWPLVAGGFVLPLLLIVFFVH